jgi:hypothetical protein
VEFGTHITKHGLVFWVVTIYGEGNYVTRLINFRTFI